ncbi:MAG: glutamate--tRNA ligase, partial [Gammaproteobacteria bacterium]|nr:glutamate--tRNA ligase [Gammaproteobacteria bacterium]
MVVSRFAPSPTGDLHICSVRTALYAWLFARQQHGKFILRIEDTDLDRSTLESVQVILDGMNWLGLNYEIGPIYQSERFERYRQVANTLIETGYAYKCYCSKERLDLVREKQMADGHKPKYDGYCRLHAIDSKESENLPYVIRFATAQSGEVHYIDRIRGELKVCNSELDDLVIIRQNGTPTYNFAVVVDDSDMDVSMVIRGDDHINNTFRQVNLFIALGIKPPQFAHVSAILGSDGKKLSKRHGATNVLAYQKEGILPEALLNALV